MGMIINEIKKLFSIKTIVVLAVGLFIIQFLFIGFHIEYFPNGSLKYDYDVHVDMQKKYGNTIEKDEIKDFQRTIDNKVQEANDYLRSREDFFSLGIDTYEKFINMDMHNEKARKLHEDVFFNKKMDLFWELQSLTGIEEIYTNKNNKRNSIMPYMVYENYNSLLIGFSMAIIFSVMVLLLGIFVSDSSKKVNCIQYTSKVGRGMVRKKVLIGLLTSIVLTTIGVLFMLILYRQNNTGMFLNCNINGPLVDTFWPDMTFKQYIILSIIGMYIVGLVSAVISMLISSVSKSLVVSIVINIVFGFILMKLTSVMVLKNITILQPMYFEIACILVGVIGSILAVIYMIKKEKKLEVI